MEYRVLPGNRVEIGKAIIFSMTELAVLGKMDPTIASIHKSIKSQLAERRASCHDVKSVKQAA